MTDARTTTEETGLTTAGIEAYVTSLSNWGRWGDDDRIGLELRYEAVTEYVGIGAHDSNTHIDGLAHYSWDGKNYIADPWQLSGLLPTEIQTSVVPLGKPTGN